MKTVLVLMAIASLAAGCGRRSASTSPPPAAEAPPGAPGAPAPAAQPPAAVPAGAGLTPYIYPSSKQTSSTSFSGAGPTGNQGQWSTVTLETTDPYEKVRDWYKGSIPQGFAQSFTNENSNEEGRQFAVWFARSDNKAWYVISLTERKQEGKVEITVTYGTGT